MLLEQCSVNKSNADTFSEVNGGQFSTSYMAVGLTLT